MMVVIVVEVAERTNAGTWPERNKRRFVRIKKNKTVREQFNPLEFKLMTNEE